MMKAFLRVVLALANALAAAVAGCVATGLVIGAVQVAVVTLSGIVPPGLPAYIDLLMIMAALANGVVPVAVAVLATRARRHPWRAMPWFVAGLLSGVATYALSAFIAPGQGGRGTYDYRMIVEPCLGLALAAIGYEVVDRLRTRGAIGSAG